MRQVSEIGRWHVSISSDTAQAQVPPILRQLGLSESQWQRQVEATESRYCRAIGALESLENLIAAWGQNWIRGLSFAKANARNG